VSSDACRFDERLRAPVRWWLLGLLFVGSLWLAFVVALPAAVALLVAGVLTAVVVGGLLGYGAARVRIDRGMFTAGRARIPVTLLADPRPLDAEAMRRTAGTEANAAAYLLLRPYLRGGVRVRVVDPADPTPYWLVSTRRPEELARALSRAGSAGSREG
jgi:hypothetical protein